jgi:hypothetical protein
MDHFTSLEIQKLLQAQVKNKRVSTWIKLIYCFGLSLPEIQKAYTEKNLKIICLKAEKEKFILALYKKL